MTWPDRPRVLIAYPYAKSLTDVGWAALASCDVVIDSGAFTAYQSGQPIDLDAYTAFLADNRGRYRFAFALDVIGDPEASFTNYRRQRRALPDDVTLVPTWHTTSPLVELERICDAAPYVSVGGSVGAYRQRGLLGRIMVKAHRVIERYGVESHGLGMSGTIAQEFPWASCDSSSWTMSQRQPLVYLARRDGSMTYIKYGKPISPANLRLVAHYGGDHVRITRYGFGSAKHVGRELSRKRTAWAVSAACRSYMWCEHAKTERDGRQYRFYFAIPGVSALAPIVNGHRQGPPWPTQ